MNEDGLDRFSAGSTRTKWDYIVELLVAYKRLMGVGVLVTAVAAYLGWISIPDLSFAHWFLAGSLLGGVTIGSSAVLYELSDYLRDQRIRVLLAPVSGGVTDVIHVPRKTFSEFDITGTHFPSRRLMSGGEILVARAVDFAEGKIVPAQEFDDDRYPDDLDVIGEDGDGSQVAKYRQALLEDARERHQITVDSEVIKESGMGDAVDMFSKALRDVRDGDIELEHLSDEQVDMQAEQLIQQMAESSPEGDSDE